MSRLAFWKVFRRIISVMLFFMLFLFSFISTPSLLQIFSTFLFVMTVGSILDAKGSLGARILKVLVYACYLVYSLYTLGIFYNLSVFLEILEGKMTQDVIFKIIFGIVAPICMVIVCKIISKFKIKGYKLISFFPIWTVYLIVAFLWDFFYPEEVSIGWLLVFWGISIIIIGYYKLRKGGASS